MKPETMKAVRRALSAWKTQHAGEAEHVSQWLDVGSMPDDHAAGWVALALMGAITGRLSFDGANADSDPEGPWDMPAIPVVTIPGAQVIVTRKWGQWEAAALWESGDGGHEACARVGIDHPHAVEALTMLLERMAPGVEWDGGHDLERAIADGSYWDDDDA